MKYLNQFDFINRTKEIIEQYKKGQIPKEEKYDITLFLNCFVGLLMLPQSKWFDNYPIDVISGEEWGITENDILTIKGNQKIVKEVAKHLRNSVAHFKFTAFSDSSNEITSFEFKDVEIVRKKEVNTFEAKISLENLQKFVNKLTDNLIEQMNVAKES